MVPNNRQTGFTIVELLIVVVVIGILAAIVIVAYNGVQTRAKNAAKITELSSIQKLFEAYKAINGVYPQQQLATSTPPTANPAGTTYPVGYCLGTGFPATGSGAVPSCYLAGYTGTYNSAYSYPENDAMAVTIRNDLGTVGKLPSPVTSLVVGSVIGPVALYYSTYINLVTVIKGETINDCPSNTARYYPGDQATLDSLGGRLECVIRLTK